MQIAQISTLLTEPKTNFLPFIKIQIYPTSRDPHKGEGISLYSLADSGCSDSVINYNYFDQHLNKSKEYTIWPSNFILNLAEKDNTLQVMGETRALIKIQDEKGNSIMCETFIYTTSTVRK